ncbi:MAG: chromosomal replication initiator protein DnaA [Elusimicrobia bacterium]|nr:chromosomal replication initiator protein DnaA [Elusimicrobiota bacterium]MDE2424401.1 chromosomal replication initiator protein DnaA [Elusimicrobiota bacterium]
MHNLDPQSLWEASVAKLRGEIGEEQFELWLKTVQALKLENGILLLKVPNKFYSSYIRENFQKRLASPLRELAGTPVELEYEVSRDLRAVLPASDPVPEASAQSDFPLSELNPRYTFSSFVTGDSNRFACATAEAIAKKPGMQYNPYFIYGGVGLGKTHLMHAIGNAIRHDYPRARVLYTTSEQFVNDFIKSLQSNPDEFRAKYRSLDCLLIDDIQFLIAKDRSEQEFFHTFNSLFDAKKQLVISSDRSPKEMAPSEQRLISRFEWGVVADVKAPDLETRIAILRKKADTEGFYVPDGVIEFVASAVRTNIRQLEGSLIRLKAFASMTGSELTVEQAREILKDSLSTEDAPPVRVETIQNAVAYKYSVDVRDLKGQQRTASIALPRQLAMYLCCVMTDLSLKEIGRAFGGKDHTTVMHARDKIAKQVEADPFILEAINRLQANIKAVENQ